MCRARIDNNSEESIMHVNLVLFKKDGTQKPFLLSSNITVIGRRRGCDLCIPLKLISRRHCKLSKEGNTVKIRDMNSRNGTFLNGKRIKEADINAGDYIRVGSLMFMLQVDGKPEEIVQPKKLMKRPTSASSKKPVETRRIPTDQLSGSFTKLDLSDSFMTELEEL